MGEAVPPARRPGLIPPGGDNPRRIAPAAGAFGPAIGARGRRASGAENEQIRPATALAKYKTGKLRQILTPALEALRAACFLARYAFRPSTGGAQPAVVFADPGAGRTRSVPAADSEALTRLDWVASELAAELRDEGNPGFYQHLVPVYHEEILFQVLSETKEAHHRGLIRTTRGRFFTDALKRYAREWGIEPKPAHAVDSPASPRKRDSAGDR